MHDARHVVLVLVLALLAVPGSGCKKKAEAAAGPKSELVTKLEALADQGCACKDAACAEQVTAAVGALAQATTQVPDQDMAPMQAAQARLDACLVAHSSLVASYRTLTDELCACTTEDCAEASSAKFSQWSADLTASGKHPTDSEVAAITQAGNRASGCFAKFGVAVPQ